MVCSFMGTCISYLTWGFCVALVGVFATSVACKRFRFIPMCIPHLLNYISRYLCAGHRKTGSPDAHRIVLLSLVCDSALLRQTQVLTRVLFQVRNTRHARNEHFPLSLSLAHPTRLARDPVAGRSFWLLRSSKSERSLDLIRSI